MDIEESMTVILKPVTDVKISITEKYFKEKFLPLLLKGDMKEFIAEWLTVCVNPYHSVKIKNSKGETVIIIPPILKQRKTRIANDVSSSFIEIIEKTRQKSEVFPKKGYKFFNEKIEKIATNELNPSQRTDWSVVIKKYLNRNSKDNIKESQSPFNEIFNYENL